MISLDVNHDESNAYSQRFLRFPGGSDLEGTVNGSYWDWRKAIGPLTERPGRPDIWGYQISNGLGLVEYLNWCDDLNMEPSMSNQHAPSS
jgi:alpha-N-arabinofuranosidase